MSSVLSPVVDTIVCFHEADQPYLERLESHLAPMCRQKLMTLWHTDKLEAGDNLQIHFVARLAQAHLVLLLVSADFNARWDGKLSAAVRRAQANESRIVPVLLRPCTWIDQPYFGLRSLPYNGQPLVTSNGPDEGQFALFASDLRSLIVNMRTNTPADVPASTLAQSALFATLAQVERERHDFRSALQTILVPTATAPEEYEHDGPLPSRRSSELDPPSARNAETIATPLVAPGFEVAKSDDEHYNVAIERLRRALAAAADRSFDGASAQGVLNIAADFIETNFQMEDRADREPPDTRQCPVGDEAIARTHEENQMKRNAFAAIYGLRARFLRWDESSSRGRLPDTTVDIAMIATGLARQISHAFALHTHLALSISQNSSLYFLLNIFQRDISLDLAALPETDPVDPRVRLTVASMLASTNCAAIYYLLAHIKSAQGRTSSAASTFGLGEMIWSDAQELLQELKNTWSATAQHGIEPDGRSAPAG